MDAIVTLENFKLMVFALIKFLNQLSEQDKVAAIKFLITTLKASTKEHFSKSRNSSRGYTFGQNTDVEQWLVADVIEKKSPPTDTDDYDENIQDFEEKFHIQLDDLANSGAFGNQALIPVIQQRSNDVDGGSGGGGDGSGSSGSGDNNSSGISNFVVLSREQRKTNIVQHLLNENSRYELNVHKLFGLSRNFLKSIFNDFVFEHWIDGKLLVKQQRMLGDIPSTTTEATLTEVVEEGTEHDDSDRELSLNDVDDEIPTPTNQSGMSAESVNHQVDPLETVEEADPTKAKPKPARKTKLYTCFQCPKVYNKRKTLAVHYKFHPGFCFDCGENYGTTIEDRVRHNRQYHSKQYPHVCETCGDSMSRNQQYLAHIKTHEKEPIIKSVCKRCGEKFTSIKAYKDHLQTMGHTDGSRVCEYCGKSFTDEAMLQQHIKRVHHTTKSHKCDHCEKSFDTRSNLTRHMQIHKDVTPSFVCDQCGGSYATIHTLREHINDKHTKKKVHICEVCQREFTNRHLYRNHIATHSEDRPFACTTCTKAFKLKTNLMRHTKRNHGTSSAGGNNNVAGETTKAKAKRKHPSSDKDESNSSTMTPPPPPQKKPFQPFSSDSPFYKNNQSIQFQASSTPQDTQAQVVPKPETPQNNQNEVANYQPQVAQKAQMPESFHVVEAYMPIKQSPQPPSTPNQNYYQYFEQPPNQHHVHNPRSQQNQHDVTSHQQLQQQYQAQQKPNNEYHQATPSNQTSDANKIHHSLPYVQSSAYHMQPHLPQAYQEAYHTQTVTNHHPNVLQSQYAQQPLKYRQSASNASQQYQQTQPPHHIQQQPQQQNHYRYPNQYHYSNHLAPSSRQLQAQQQQPRHANVMGMPQNCYDVSYNSGAESQTNHSPSSQQQQQQQQQHTPHQMQPSHPTVAQTSEQHKAPATKYPTYYDANTHAQYDHMQSHNLDTGWNNLNPSLVDQNQSAQYGVPMRPEMPKFNKVAPTQPTVANDTKMQQQQQQQQQQQPQYPYQNMWPTESAQMEYAPKAIDSNIVKHEQQQNSSTATSASNSYNSIGNILTNLELLGNNSNLDTSNFELIGSNYDQQYGTNSWM